MELHHLDSTELQAVQAAFNEHYGGKVLGQGCLASVSRMAVNMAQKANGKNNFGVSFTLELSAASGGFGRRIATVAFNQGGQTVFTLREEGKQPSAAPGPSGRGRAKRAAPRGGGRGGRKRSMRRGCEESELEEDASGSEEEDDAAWDDEEPAAAAQKKLKPEAKSRVMPARKAQVHATPVQPPKGLPTVVMRQQQQQLVATPAALATPAAAPWQAAKRGRGRPRKTLRPEAEDAQQAGPAQMQVGAAIQSKAVTEVNMGAEPTELRVAAMAAESSPEAVRTPECVALVGTTRPFGCCIEACESALPAEPWLPLPQPMLLTYGAADGEQSAQAACVQLEALLPRKRLCIGMAAGEQDSPVDGSGGAQGEEALVDDGFDTFVDASYQIDSSYLIFHGCFA